MAQHPGGFQNDTIHGFLRYVSDNIPCITENDLMKLFNHMKSVGAISEEELYKINEKDLGKLVGQEKAKLIMQYCKSKMTAASKGAPNDNEEVNAERGRSNEQSSSARCHNVCKGCGADSPSATLPTRRAPTVTGSSAAHAQELQLYPSGGHLEAAFDMFLKIQENEERRTAKMVEAISNTFRDAMSSTVNQMTTMMQDQVSRQRELLKRVDETEESNAKRQDQIEARAMEWMKSTQEMNREYLDKLAERINDAIRSKEEIGKSQRKGTEGAGCAIM